MKCKALLPLVSVTMFALLAATARASSPDTVTLTSITTNPSSTQSGGSQNYNLPGTVNAGDTIHLYFTVGASGSGSTSTTYPDTLHITFSTLVKPSGASDATVDGLADCTLSGRSSTCSESATLTAPSTPGAYQVKILADDGRTGTGKMNSDFFFVNFTVVVPQCTPAPTILAFKTSQVCTALHSSSVSLSANLTSGNPPTGLAGKTITFYVDGTSVGTAETDSDGLATLTFDPSSLTVGDHAISAAWVSDNECYVGSQATGGKLDLTYLFLGFQPPINADGSTILTGKSGPVKVKITDAQAGIISDATALVFFELGTPVIVGTDSTNATTGLNFDYGNAMRYDPTANQYVYNWDLSSVTNGTYTLRVNLNDGTAGCNSPDQVVVSVGKKH